MVLSHVWAVLCRQAMLDRAAAEEWIRRHVVPTAPIELVHARPWSTVLRIRLAHGHAYFKACEVARTFESRLTYELSQRWPDRVARVLAVDVRRNWLLMADAGTQLRMLDNSPEVWLRALPQYAELQCGEARFADHHVVHGVPDQRIITWPAHYAQLLESGLPLTAAEVLRLEAFAPDFERLCDALGAYAIPPTVQHDDLHYNNLFVDGNALRILDWGDASVSHPFVSLVVTFRFLEEFNGLARDDPWFNRLRDAYLEPWPRELRDAFGLALRLGGFVHCFGWLGQRNTLTGLDRERFDEVFPIVLRRALNSII